MDGEPRTRYRMARGKLVIAAAQSSSRRGDLDGNISGHFRFIEAAASRGVNLVVFPELSLTGYELDLAGAVQFEQKDSRFDSLREAAKKHAMHLLVGGPRVSGRNRPYLGAFLLSPDRSLCYDKIHVHQSEEKYFAAGKEGCVVAVEGVATGVAICADTSHPDHAAASAGRGAELYVASVMNTRDDFPAHAARLQRYALGHGMAVLTANYAGSTGGLESAGKSAVWDERGRLVVQAESNGEALVVARRINGKWSGEVISSL